MSCFQIQNANITVFSAADVDLLFEYAVTMRKLGYDRSSEALADLAARITSTIPGHGDGAYVRKAWESVKMRSLAMPAGRPSP